MADILSNDELDDLLAAVDAAPQSRATAKAESKIATYDFRRPNRLTREHVHLLQPLNTAAAESLSGRLSEMLRATVEVNAIGIDALPFANFIGSLPSPVCLNVFSVGKLPEKGLLTMDIPLVLAIVDRVVGGPGLALEQIRPLTELEQRIIDRPTRMALEILSKSWQPVANAEFAFEERRMDPKMLQIAPASEVALRIIFAVGGQIGSGEMIFSLPFSALDKMMPREQMRERFHRADQDASPEEKKALGERLKAAPVTVTAVLGRTELTLKQLAELRVDHVLPLNRRVTAPLDVLVQGVPKFKARPGRVGRTLSVQVCKSTDTIPSKGGPPHEPRR